MRSRRSIPGPGRGTSASSRTGSSAPRLWRTASWSPRPISTSRKRPRTMRRCSTSRVRARRRTGRSFVTRSPAAKATSRTPRGCSGSAGRRFTTCSSSMAFRPDLRIHGFLLAALALGGAAAAAPRVDSLAAAAEALARGDGIAAEVAARKGLEAGAPSSEVAALIGEAELLQGDLGDARRWLGPADFSPATRERGFHALARLEMQEGDLAAAAEAFDKALQTGGGNARLWVDIGRLRYLAGQHHSVRDASARALTLDPEDPRALEFQAQLVRDAQGVRAALPLLERAIELAPDDLGLLGEYAATLGEAGRHRDMLRVARRMVEIDP